MSNTAATPANLPIEKLPKALLFDFGDTLVEILSQSRERGVKALLTYSVPGSYDSQSSQGKQKSPASQASQEARDSLGSPASQDPLRLKEEEPSSLLEQLCSFGRDLDFRFESLCSTHNIEYRQLDFHRLLYGRFGINFSIDEDELEWRYWKASLELRQEQGLKELLEVLRQRNVRMAVISNTTYRGWILERELEKQGLLHYFEFLLSSADFGIRKPDPLLFDIALKKMKLSPDEAWYAGNLASVDCAGAAAAGMKPVWYAVSDSKAGRYEHELPKLPQGSLIIRQWPELTRTLHEVKLQVGKEDPAPPS